MLKNNTLEKRIIKFLDRLDAHQNSIVVLSVAQDVSKAYIKPILDTLLNYLENGTLCVMGDCGFNTSDSSIDYLKELNNRERLVLSSDYALQLLSLRHDSYFVKHPSLSIGCVGHYARYLTRHQHLDFPYGDDSIFKDLHELNAVFLSVGDVKYHYALKYAFNLDEDKVISKNLCVYDEKVMSYLDFEADYETLEEMMLKFSTLDTNSIPFYGAKYPDLIDKLVKNI